MLLMFDLRDNIVPSKASVNYVKQTRFLLDTHYRRRRQIVGPTGYLVLADALGFLFLKDRNKQ